jgi:hypothetical protein
MPEFIYFDLNKLYCYNKFRKLLYDFSFPPTTGKPFMVKFPDGEMHIGAITPKTGDVFLFGKNGTIYLDPVIRGNTPFDLGILDPDLGTSILIGDGKYVRNFLLSK